MQRQLTSMSAVIRHLILNAHRCLQYGEYRRSMEFVCTSIEKMLATRMDSVVRLVRQRLPAIGSDIRVLHTELGFRVELVKAEYAEEECVSLLHYALLLHDSVTGNVTDDAQDNTFFRCTFTERILLIVQALSRRCIVSHHSAATRPLLRGLLRLRSFLEQRLPSERISFAVQARVLSLILNEPEVTSQMLMRECRFHCELNFAKRHLHLRGLPASQHYLDSFVWPQRQEYLDYIAAQPGSRVLVTIHMGDFLGAFRRIRSLGSPGRAAISLRREADSEREKDYSLLNRQGHTILRHGEYNPITIVSALRKGDHTLAVLFDLRDEFGATVPGAFFGHPARFVKGPAQLAIMGKAPILPFVTFERGGESIIEMEPIVDTQLLSGESLGQATSRVTQQLVCLAEKWIRRTPEQWKYLNVMSTYFERPEDVAGENTVPGVKSIP